MTDEQSRPNPGSRLTDHQQTRIDFARRDLDAARAADLARLDQASLILIIERLRRRLDDMMQMIDEVGRP